ncbi:MAG: PgaD family protein [Acetobacteraceae bacterium]|nr:PgaD family protein [Acetobacteraceae bacterium]
MTHDTRPLPPHEWPPLITAARQPRWMPWRDRALTALMWVLLALLCHNTVRLVFDEVRVAMGLPRLRPEPDFMLLWGRLEPYLVVIGVLLAWILTWGLLALRRLRHSARLPRPPGLSVTEEAARQAIAPEALEGWSVPRIAVVRVDPDGRMQAEPRGAAPAAVSSGGAAA